MCQVSDVPSGITGCNVNLVIFIIHTNVIVYCDFFGFTIMTNMCDFDQIIHTKSSLIYGVIDEF